VVVSTHLKNNSQNGFIFPKVRGKNIIYLKPPPRILVNFFCSPLSSFCSRQLWHFLKRACLFFRIIFASLQGTALAYFILICFFWLAACHASHAVEEVIPGNLPE